MVKDDEKLLILAAGGAATILLGAALVPLREATSASNLAFPFIILTIIVAELGGFVPALVTAIGSSLSLNFFLTKPYMKLTIHGTDDIIAFLGLTACGLVVAAFAKRRVRS